MFHLIIRQGYAHCRTLHSCSRTKPENQPTLKFWPGVHRHGDSAFREKCWVGWLSYSNVGYLDDHHVDDEMIPLFSSFSHFLTLS